jgi:glucokinase
VTQSGVLGIDIGGTKISACVATADGQVVVADRQPTRSHDGAAAVLDRLCKAAVALLERVRSAGLVEVQGVGVATPGVVGPHGVALAPNNEGWDSVPLAATVADRLGMAAVRADNDAKAATAAEATWGALSGVDNGLLLNLGTGISAGAIVDGRLVRGAHGAALEIAYQLPSTGAARGFATGDAPLEQVFSGSGLTAAATALMGRPTDAAEVFAAMAAAADGPPPAVGHDDRLVSLGVAALDVGLRALVNLAIALDPELIAVSGGMLRSEQQILTPLRAALATFVPFPPSLVNARFNEHAPLVGACLLAYRSAGLAVPSSFDLGPLATP